MANLITVDAGAGEWVVNTSWAAQVAMSFHRKLVAGGMSLTRARALYESFYQGLMQGNDEEVVECLLSKAVQKAKRLDAYDEGVHVFFARLHYVNHAMVVEAAQRLLAFVEENAVDVKEAFRVAERETRRQAADALKAQKAHLHEVGSPMVQALRKAGLVS